MIKTIRFRQSSQQQSTTTTTTTTNGTTPLLDSLINTTAQVAFKNQDVAKSIEAHVPRKIDDEPHKSITFKKGTLLYLKSSVSYGSYAVLFCIAIVIGLEAFFYKLDDTGVLLTSGHDWNLVVLFITTVILTGSALAFAFIEGSNKRVEINFYESEKRRETWEYDNYVEGEQREMVELYCKKGMSNDDAVTVVTLLSKYRDLFVDIMMAEELNLIPVELNLTPLHNGLTAFISFIIFGMVPLIPFFFSRFVFSALEKNIIFPLFILTVETELFLIGAAKSKFYTGIWWREGLISAWNGITSILGSIFVGYMLGYLGLSINFKTI